MITISITDFSSVTRCFDRASIKKLFNDEGVTVTQWAHDHGFRRETVYAVLDGRIKGTRGEGHLIAIALGLKNKTKGLNPVSGPSKRDKTQ